MIETIVPKSEAHWLELRVADITSTESSALFNLSPYTTKFELWHRKNEQQQGSFEATTRMLWGTRLQDSIAAGIASDKGWKIRRMDEYMRDPDLKMGSSFDFVIEGGEDDGALLEIKNVDSLAFKNGWSDDGVNVEAPPMIEIQVQHQLAVAEKAPHSYLGAFIGGNRYELIKRDRDEKVIRAIKSKVSQFWDSIFNNERPEPDFEKDAEFIQSLYAFAAPGTRLDVSGDAEMDGLVADYKMYGDAAKGAESSKQAIKSQILMKIGEAEKAVGIDFKISAGMIGPAEIAYQRRAYRDFRIYFSKEKT